MKLSAIFEIRVTPALIGFKEVTEMVSQHWASCNARCVAYELYELWFPLRDPYYVPHSFDFFLT